MSICLSSIGKTSIDTSEGGMVGSDYGRKLLNLLNAFYTQLIDLSGTLLYKVLTEQAATHGPTAFAAKAFAHSGRRRSVSKAVTGGAECDGVVFICFFLMVRKSRFY